MKPGFRKAAVVSAALTAGAAIAIMMGGCGEGAQAPIFGPTPGLGTRRLIAFVSDRGRAPGLTDVYLYDVDAPGLIALTGLNTVSAAELDPALSDDAARLFFAADRGLPGDTDIYAYDVTSRQMLALPGVNSAMAESDPAPAADGLHLAFVRRFGAFRRIFVAQGWPPDSTIRLAGLDSAAAFNDFSPASDSTARRIAFATDRAGNRDVMVWDRDSARVLKLPDLASPDDEVEPSITPSGRFVAFASNRPSTGGGYRIYLYDLEARAFVLLPGIDSDGDDRHPSVSADAQRIAFESNRTLGTAGQDLWIYERAQSRARSTPPLASAGNDLQPWLRSR